MADFAAFRAALAAATDSLLDWAEGVEEQTRVARAGARLGLRGVEGGLNVVGRGVEALGGLGVGVAGAALGGAAGVAGRAAGVSLALSSQAAHHYSVSGGNEEAAASSFTLSALGSVKDIPLVGGLVSGATGATGATNVLDATRQQVGDVTTDLARYGIEVTDEFRQGQIDVALEQQRRIQQERTAIETSLGSAENLAKASPGTLAGGVGIEIREALKGLRDDVRGIWNSLGGGSPR